MGENVVCQLEMPIKSKLQLRENFVGNQKLFNKSQISADLCLQ